MEDIVVPIVVVGMLFLGLPWLILSFVTKWRTTSGLTREDEDLLDSLNDTARRLEERLATIERIVSADHPDFTPVRGAPAPEADATRYSRSN